MRQTHSETIARTDIKPGDKIRISRVVTVKKVRETSIYAGSRVDRKPVTIVETDGDTMAITNDEQVKLLERDKDPIVEIPLNALIVTWKDRDGYDHIARRTDVGETWATSQDGPESPYTTEELVDAIDDGSFDGFTKGSFEVLKRKPEFATGGYVQGLKLSQQSLDSLNRAAQQKIVGTSRVERTNRSPITGYPMVP